MEKIPAQEFLLSGEECAVIDDFRKSKDTAVLTIMFTDIKGFTSLTEEKGDAHANAMRRAHDQILVRAIEEQRAGKVVKHIGDAVMAVFAEPSAAVERALVIQERIRQFNREHPQQAPLLVRIGLHMGQVTTENKINLDVFGRHVNRASRVEGLADGGQIYLTYSVFDSAKGWLVGHADQEAAWKLHGQYYVKGIEEPLEIYEVFNAQQVRPRPPERARKKRSVPTLAVSLALVLCGVLGVLAVLWFQKTSVIFVNMGAREPILDHKVKLLLEGEPGQSYRQAITKIPAGRHVVHYDVSYVVRYYTEFTVKRGKNYIEPRFEYHDLPALEQRLTFEPRARNQIDTTAVFIYPVYNEQNHKQNDTVAIHMALAVSPDQANPALLRFDCRWDVKLNGKEINRDHAAETNLAAESESKQTEKTIYTDSYHYYFTRYYVSASTIDFEIGAGYKEIK
jgi:class 3 adenylate cyclase